MAENPAYLRKDMTMRKKLVFWENAVETLGYFSHELSDYFMENGYECFFVDHKNAQSTIEQLSRWVEPGNTVFITFNFIGLSGEPECMGQAQRIWEEWKIACICIMVDHPFYYYKQLHDKTNERVKLFCVDRGHVAYAHRFYPQADCEFLPLAGNKSRQDVPWVPYEERSYDISLIANFVPLEDLEIHLNNQPEEYVEFYREIIGDLKAHPAQMVDEVLERYILREIPEVTDTDICSAEAGMIAVDLYIRSLYRMAVLNALTDAGLRVHVFGRGWSKCPVQHRENLISNGKMLTSAQCVEIIRNSKIALNIMPWFKDGAHDRIFTAMLNGAVSLTDDSRYLREILTDGEDVCFYKLTNLTEIAKKAEYLLAHEEKAETIIKHAYQTADQDHTWKERAKQLEHFWTET